MVQNQDCRSRSPNNLRNVQCKVCHLKSSDTREEEELAVEKINEKQQQQRYSFYIPTLQGFMFSFFTKASKGEFEQGQIRVRPVIIT